MPCMWCARRALSHEAFELLPARTYRDIMSSRCVPGLDTLHLSVRKTRKRGARACFDIELFLLIVVTVLVTTTSFRYQGLDPRHIYLQIL